MYPVFASWYSDVAIQDLVCITLDCFALLAKTIQGRLEFRNSKFGGRIFLKRYWRWAEGGFLFEERKGRNFGSLVHYTALLQYNARLHTMYYMKLGKKLGKNLKRIRLAKKLSQGDLSKSLGVDRAYISNIENGRMNPTLSTLGNLAGALEISVDQLLK